MPVVLLIFEAMWAIYDISKEDLIKKQTLNNFCILKKCTSSISVMMVKYFQVDFSGDLTFFVLV